MVIDIFNISDLFPVHEEVIELTENKGNKEEFVSTPIKLPPFRVLGEDMLSTKSKVKL